MEREHDPLPHGKVIVDEDDLLTVEVLLENLLERKRYYGESITYEAIEIVVSKLRTIIRQGER